MTLHSARWQLALATLLAVAACSGGTPTAPPPPPPPPPTPVANVLVQPEAVTLAPGQTTTLSATPRDAGGIPLSGRTITWATGNASVATVSAAGMVTAVAAGNALISATSEGRTGTAQVTVQVPVASVTIQPATLSLAPGESGALTAAPRDASGNALAGRTITWSTSNAGVATVSETGVVTGVAAGTATITAASEGQTGTAQVTVQAAVASVLVQPAAVSLSPGQTAPLTAIPQDAGGNPLPGRPVTWSTSNPGAATVSGAGVVTAVAAGSATITATSEGQTGVAQVTVAVPVASVTVQPAAVTLTPGQVAPLTATPRDAGGNPLSGRPISWASSNLSVATVSTSGVVTAVAAGTATITATSEGQSGTALVTVLAPVTTVTLAGAQRVKVGDEYQFSVTARTADGTIVNRPVSWSVLVPGSAIITQAGRLTPLQTGVITIVVTIDGENWTGTTTAYDWGTLVSGGSQFVFLDADLQLTTRHGSTAYPELVISCSGSGKMFVWVDTRVFITASGGVSFYFDDGPILSQTWIEFDSFRALGHPGPTNLQVKAFLSNLTASRRFGFAFSEFLGSAKATLFRVTGLTPRLAPLLAACPSNSLVGPMAAPPTAEEIEAVRAQLRAPTVAAAERLARLQAGPAAAYPLSVTISGRGEEVQVMVRRQ